MTATLETPAAIDLLCQAQHVSHEYVMPSGTTLRVLDDINLAIKPS